MRVGSVVATLLGSLVVMGACAVTKNKDAPDALSDATPPSQAATGVTRKPFSYSGSRLSTRSTFIKSDDGAFSLTYQGFVDRKLDIDCYFETYEDGSSRCVPSGANVATITDLYSDAECTTPYAMLPIACTKPFRMAIGKLPLTQCATWPRYRVFNMGKLVSPAPTTVYTGGNGAPCVKSASGWPHKGHNAYVLTGPIDASELQSGKVQSAAE